MRKILYILLALCLLLPAVAGAGGWGFGYKAVIVATGETDQQMLEYFPDRKSCNDRLKLFLALAPVQHPDWRIRGNMMTTVIDGMVVKTRYYCYPASVNPR